MAIRIDKEIYLPFGEVNVGYITANGREACIIFDPNSNPLSPFTHLADLEAYLAKVEADFLSMPPIESTQVTSSDTTIIKWRSDIFWRRFTPTERVALITAANDDPILDDFRMLMMMSPIIVSNDSELLAGMDYIVTKGVISSDRKLELLGGE